MDGRKVANGRGRHVARRSPRSRTQGIVKASAPQRRLRSQEWFDNSAHPDMTAIYLERYLN